MAPPMTIWHRRFLVTPELSSGAATHAAPDFS